VSDFVAFTLAGNNLSAFSAQKSHVKPPNRLTLYSSTTSAWHVSSAPPAIMNIDRKKVGPGDTPGLTY
jgi:hypothetical protein